MSDNIKSFLLGAAIVFLILVGLSVKAAIAAEDFCNGYSPEGLEVSMSKTIGVSPICQLSTNKGTVIYYDSEVYFREAK